MREQVEKPKENTRKSVPNSVTQKTSNGEQSFGFVDNRKKGVLNNTAYTQLPAKSRGILQRDEYNNSETGLTYNVQINGNLIIANHDQKNHGSLKFSMEDGFVNLLQIESHPEKGSGLGSLMIYLLASTISVDVIKIPMATPDERGFYNHMGFSPDPQEVKKWSDVEKITEEEAVSKYGHLINLVGNRENVKAKAKQSFDKRWSLIVADKKSGDKQETTDKRCFITTACVEAYGKEDDCWELTTLRQFRDSYMRKIPEGNELIIEYYQIAPIILDQMRKEPNYLDLIKELYAELVLKSIELIDKGKKYEAMIHYKTITSKLQSKFYHSNSL